MPKDVKEEIDITDGGSIKSVISEMNNMELKSESTGNNYNKSEKMWNYFSDDTREFPKKNKMEKNGIEGASGTQLARSLTVFSTCKLRKSKPDLDGQKITFGVH